MDNYNYPLGADTPDAPWNQCDPDPIDIEVEVIETYTKTITVPVTDYTVTEDYDDDCDEGRCIARKCLVYDYDDCNLKEAFENNHYTIEELLKACKETLTEYRNTFLEKSVKWREIDNLITETEGWNQENIEIYKT